MFDAPDRNASLSVMPDDPDEFYRAVEPYVSKMGRVAGRLAGPAEGEDVVQLALLNAWRNRRQFDPTRGSLSAWLMAITAHEASRARRHLGIRLAPRREPADLPSPEWIDLASGIQRLTSRQRLAIDCYYFIGLSIAETAGVMRCSEGTVKSTLADARDQLRGLLR